MVKIKKIFLNNFDSCTNNRVGSNTNKEMAMDFTSDEWEFESFEDDLPSFPEWEWIEDDTEHEDDWPNDMCGEDE